MGSNDHAVDRGEQRKVSAHLDVEPMNRPALTHQNVAGQYLFAAESLNAQSFGMAIATAFVPPFLYVP